MSLTPKQEKFCHVYVETGNASEAYRQAYDAEKSSDAVIHVDACKLKKNPKVALRVEELRCAARENHDITMNSLSAMLVVDHSQAKEANQFGPAISAVNLLAKLHGLLIERTEADVTVRNPTAIPCPETFEEVLLYEQCHKLNVDAAARAANGSGQDSH